MAIDTKIKCRLSKHFMNVESPIPYYIVCNPQGGDNSFLEGSDVQMKPAGAWTLNCYELISQFSDHWTLDDKGELTLRKGANADSPVFTMELQYDSSLLAEGQSVVVSYYDVNFESVAGIQGQLVNFNQQPILSGLDSVNDNNNSLNAVTVGKLDQLNENVTELKASINALYNFETTKIYRTEVEILDMRGNIKVSKFNRLGNLISSNQIDISSEDYWYDFPVPSLFYSWGRAVDSSSSTGVGDWMKNADDVLQIKLHYISASPLPGMYQIDLKTISENWGWAQSQIVSGAFRVFAKN